MARSGNCRCVFGPHFPTSKQCRLCDVSQLAPGPL
uniref:Uncharacterized protein n=1 Tax=Anguilla anguilla TaxID=7936 RepID=A0A0E9XSL6_ANGAN